jgi:hypothetical protein
MASSAFAAHEITQNFTLNPGWNAVFLEVQPSNNAIEAVFQGIPLSSVWAYRTKGEPTEFVQDLDEGVVDKAQWLVYFDTNRVEKMFNNLFAVHANRPYFIKLAGSSAAPWSVTGRPAVPSIDWQPGSFNLVGFALAPTNLPSVATFLSHSTSLVNQAVYRLTSTGTWRLVTAPASENVAKGESMWVYADTGTDYTGPVRVDINDGNGIDYGGSVSEVDVKLVNVSAFDAVVTVTDLTGGAGSELAYWVDLGGGLFDFQDLSSPLTVNLDAGTTHLIRLALRRENITGTLFETTLEVNTDLGTRVHVPVTGRKE